MTSFEFQLHPVGPMVLAGGAFFSWDRLEEITAFYLDYVKNVPDELTTALFYWGAPPAPFLPESIHGKERRHHWPCATQASIEAGEKVVAPIRALAPTVDIIGPMPFTALQAMFDPILPKSTCGYIKSDYFDDIPPAMVDDMIEWARRKPGRDVPGASPSLRRRDESSRRRRDALPSSQSAVCLFAG